jgi:SsrA-binding protein
MSLHVQDYDAKRKRKLLLHKQEILKLQTKVKEKGLSVIALEVYVSARGKIKVLIGLGKGKKSYDKRESLKRKDIKRETARELSRR